jgi:hypothetical protein
MNQEVRLQQFHRAAHGKTGPKIAPSTATHQVSRRDQSGTQPLAAAQTQLSRRFERLGDSRSEPMVLALGYLPNLDQRALDVLPHALDERRETQRVNHHRLA